MNFVPRCMPAIEIDDEPQLDATITEQAVSYEPTELASSEAN